MSSAQLPRELALKKKHHILSDPANSSNEDDLLRKIKSRFNKPHVPTKTAAGLLNGRSSNRRTVIV